MRRTMFLKRDVLMKRGVSHKVQHSLLYACTLDLSPLFKQELGSIVLMKLLNMLTDIKKTQVLTYLWTKLCETTLASRPCQPLYVSIVSHFHFGDFFRISQLGGVHLFLVFVYVCSLMEVLHYCLHQLTFPLV